MDWDLKLFRDLILAIWDHHEKPWEYSNPEARAIYDEIQANFNSMSDRNEIEFLLPSEENVVGEFNRRFLYLNPVTHGQILVPILSLKCDFGRSIPEIRLRLGLFQRHDGNVKAIGFRFEAPEGTGPAGTSIHHYYHLQMIRGLDTGGHFPPDECLRWMPDSEPTIPLDVNGSVKLLLCLLISLYGIDNVIALVRNTGSGSQISQYLSQMNCHGVPAIEWYWKIVIGDSNKSLYYKTAKLPSDFETHFRRKYTGCTIVGVTKGSFDALPDTKKKEHR